MRKALLVHVPYQVRGGEDVAVESQAAALRDLGYGVTLWPEDRHPPKVTLGKALPGLKRDERWESLEDRISALRPDFALLNNIFPLYGPRLMHVLAAKEVPIFYAIHNHRLYCANGLAMRGGRVCKSCKNKNPWRAVAFNCNADLKRSAYYALALARLPLRKVAAFIAPSPYIGSEVESLGIEPERVRWIVNPVLLPTAEQVGETAPLPPRIDVFFGSRLSPEKGVPILLEAIEGLPHVQFAIAGDGQLRGEVERAALRLRNLHYLGAQPRAAVLGLLRRSTIAVLPSQCNEALPTSVLEAFVLGKRCVIPDMESTRWLAEEPFFGVLANTFDAVPLRGAIQAALQMRPPEPAEISRARQFFGFERYKSSLSGLLQKALAKPAELR